jgi:hypothetical protein
LSADRGAPLGDMERQRPYISRQRSISSPFTLPSLGLWIVTARDGGRRRIEGDRLATGRIRKGYSIIDRPACATAEARQKAALKRQPANLTNINAPSA